jgi:hypothetical protein
MHGIRPGAPAIYCGTGIDGGCRNQLGRERLNQPTRFPDRRFDLGVGLAQLGSR